MVAVDSTLFPNYLQMRERVPVWVWHTLGAGMVVGALGLIAVLFVAPRTGLIAWWLFVLPVLPLLLMLAPGVWRNVCPMAALNQYPRVFGFSRGKTVPPWLKSNAVLLQAVLYFALISTRAPIFDHNGAAVGALMLVALGAAFGGGIVFKGKSGWCGTFCPLMPMQRLYGQTPAVVIPNAHCRPCVGCTKNCYDFNPHVAAVADANDEDQHYLGQRKVFAAAFPGFVLAFFTIPHSHVGEPADIGISVADFYLWTGGYMLISIGAFFLLDALSPVTPLMLMALFGAIGLNLHNILRFPTAFAFDKPVWLLGIEYAAVAAVTAVFLVRTRRKERRLDELALEPLPVRLGAGAESALRHAADDERPEVVIVPEDRRIAVAPGSSLLEIVERAGLPIEAGCRLGVCGSDPVCIVSGADNLSPIEADEQATLERLGLAESTRMACSTRVLGTVSVSLVPERKQVRAGPAAEPADPSIGRVVVVGNGIAGVTAADYVRRGHPTCEIDLIGREGHHLYNRMAITRLIYGRSAMQGLYLLPESWYDEHGISCWLNTRVLAIDRTRKEVQLATGDVLGYDRLILTGGSASFVPPIEGFGTPGTFPLRTADDAMAIRGYLQDHRCREPVVVGAGLLGLEAAYALHKLGLHPTVLARGQLLQRELDEPGSRFLRRFLEGLGFEIVSPAEAASVQTEHGRVSQVTLADGRTLPCDLLLVTTGIVSNVELARDAGLAVGRGVLVDDGMRTDDPAIFAAGDVAEHRGRILGLWPTAVDQGRVAGMNALGGEERYLGAPPVTILKVTGVDLTSLGRIDPEAGDTVIALEDEVESRYRKLVIAGGTLAGAILLGYPDLTTDVTAAVKQRRDVSGLLDELRAGDWDVLSAAPQVAARV